MPARPIDPRPIGRAIRAWVVSAGRAPWLRADKLRSAQQTHTTKRKARLSMECPRAKRGRRSPLAESGTLGVRFSSLEISLIFATAVPWARFWGTKV